MAKLNILIIDDEKSYHHQFSRILTNEKFNVECTMTGEKALTKIKHCNYDLIILDMVLMDGKMSGLETLENIQKLDSNVPIALTSAYANDKQVSEAIINKKAQTYINKPINEEELTLIVNSAIKWKKTSLEFINKKIKTTIKLNENSIIKRCFLNNTLYCPLQIEVQSDLIFIGMPFTNRLDQNIYSKGIAPAIDCLKFKHWRADEELNNIVIICKICQKIQAAEYCIFDLTTWNANVMFELGLSLGLAKRSLLLKSKNTRIPTDSKGFEYIEHNGDHKNLKNKIIEYFKRIINESIPKKI
ncbi:MAG: response regulator [Candidatus Hodarchaeota archaeon]